MRRVKVFSSFLLIALLAMSCGDDNDTSDNNQNNVNNANNLNNANNQNNANNANNLNNQNNANNANNANNLNNANNANNLNNANNANNENTGPAYEQPFITRFEFREQTGGIVSQEGYSVNSATRAIDNLQGRTVVIDDDADWMEYEETVITNTDLIDQMNNGFECPELEGDDPPIFEFEARIQDAGFETKIQVISGCVVEETANVQPIIDLFDRLVADYLP